MSKEAMVIDSIRNHPFCFETIINSKKVIKKNVKNVLNYFYFFLYNHIKFDINISINNIIDGNWNNNWEDMRKKLLYTFRLLSIIIIERKKKIKELSLTTIRTK